MPTHQNFNIFLIMYQLHHQKNSIITNPITTVSKITSPCRNIFMHRFQRLSLKVTGMFQFPGFREGFFYLQIFTGSFGRFHGRPDRHREPFWQHNDWEREREIRKEGRKGRRLAVGCVVVVVEVLVWLMQKALEEAMAAQRREHRHGFLSDDTKHRLNLASLSLCLCLIIHTHTHAYIYCMNHTHHTYIRECLNHAGMVNTLQEW